MDDLGLNQHHKSIIFSYIKFARYLRSQNERQIEHSFEDVESKLFDDTYTKDEVKKLLLDLKKIISCDMESDFISFAYNNVLMLQQLFAQAEKWYLRLQIDISELQNRDLLDAVQRLESKDDSKEREFRSESPKDVEDNAVLLLRMEIDRLREENDRLTNVVQEVEDKADSYREEKNSLTEKLLNAHKEISHYKVLFEEPRDRLVGDSSEIKKMEEKLKVVEEMLNVKNEESNINREELNMELLSTKAKVKQVEAQLQLAEMELERKFNETKAYANMKQILMNKNEQIKKLREMLEKYEPSLNEMEEMTED